MKKRAGLALCLLAVIIVSICVGFTGGFTVGVSKNKNEFFSAFAQKVAPAADSELFARLFGGESKSEEVSLKTFFGEIQLTDGEVFENTLFYSADRAFDVNDMKLTVTSSDENVASASIFSINEASVSVEIFAKALGEAEIFLSDEKGNTVSEKVCVSVGSAAGSEETTESETTVPLQSETKEETTEVEKDDKEKETTKKVRTETTEKATSALTEEVTENKREREKYTQPTTRRTEKETRKETTKQPESARAEETGGLVYRTPSGSCYHRAGCRYIKSSATALTVSEAKRSGLRACKVCKP